MRTVAKLCLFFMGVGLGFIAVLCGYIAGKSDDPREAEILNRGGICCAIVAVSIAAIGGSI